MSETARLNLPLLAPSQAQKHVTVNEALLRLDALSQLVLASRSRGEPPADALEGDCYAVPSGAVDEWAGAEGAIALFTNGGWQFLAPTRGWRAWIEDEGVQATFTGDWNAEVGGAPQSGIRQRTIHIDFPLGSGTEATTDAVITGSTLVYGVTGRVTAAIGGAPTFQLGVPGSSNRYGSGIGAGEGSWLRGLTSSPLAYWSDTPLLLTAEGGEFDGTGTVRLAVHFAELALPE